MSKEAIYNSATNTLEWAGRPVKVEPGTIGNSDLDFFDDFAKRQKATEKMKQDLLDSMHNRVNSSSIEKEEKIIIHEEKTSVPIQKNENVDHGMIYISGKNEVTKVVGEQQIMKDKSEKMKHDLLDFMHDRIEKEHNKIIIHEEKKTSVPIQKYVETDHVVQRDERKGLIEKIKDKIPIEKIKEKIPAHHRKEIRGIFGKIKENIPTPIHLHHSKGEEEKKGRK